jgi:hypothetical protein
MIAPVSEIVGPECLVVLAQVMLAVPVSRRVHTAHSSRCFKNRHCAQPFRSRAAVDAVLGFGIVKPSTLGGAAHGSLRAVWTHLQISANCCQALQKPTATVGRMRGEDKCKERGKEDWRK